MWGREERLQKVQAISKISTKNSKCKEYAEPLLEIKLVS
jgi:hypothetical protein